MFANVGSMQAQPGKAAELLAILTRANPALAEVGCLTYEVGLSEDEPDTVRVVELWTSRQAHQDALGLDAVQAMITEARPLLTGVMSGAQFDVLGSPLR